jgi:CRISPR-associated exonuclease Cas4
VLLYSEDELLPLAGVADFAFCPRRAALHRIEQVWKENVATAEGHILHDRAHEAGAESRGNVHIVRGLRLRSLQLGLTGVADVVEFHRVGDTETAFPVEYKRGIQRHELSFEIQLCAQTMCLEEMLNVEVPTGALFYGLSKRRHDVSFDPDLRAATECAARGLHELVNNGKTPPAVYEKKCKNCSLLELCMPKTTGGGKSAEGYLKSVIEDLG